MKTKPLSKVIKEIREANKDPEFRKAVARFIAYHEGKLSLYNFSNIPDS